MQRRRRRGNKHVLCLNCCVIDRQSWQSPPIGLWAFSCSNTLIMHITSLVWDAACWCCSFAPQAQLHLKLLQVALNCSTHNPKQDSVLGSFATLGAYWDSTHSPNKTLNSAWWSPGHGVAALSQVAHARAAAATGVRATLNRGDWQSYP